MAIGFESEEAVTLGAARVYMLRWNGRVNSGYSIASVDHASSEESISLVADDPSPTARTPPG